ncbi:putative fungal specific transcription protein [Eutypa lata UCREL1]|uniref:Putative fungal specific transcription protein n=1 Tax=Eutypa lata (strain UCR-EL1) TaxID=1287681 RepID=M7TZ51_EUTLA|nr:putative fungal specific transcription protein [Eutypa lata UCREL1]
MDQAEAFLSRYTQEMAIHLPAVVFPPSMTAAVLRKTKPYLFLGIMAAASSEIPQIQRQLANDVVHLIADRVVVHGEKSIELIQLFLVTVIWYYPPEHFEELKFYQFVHMAAVMAIDIGLGRKRNTGKSRLIPSTWRDHPFRRQTLPEPTSIEARRTWLSAYFLASNVSMALHRTNLIRWNSFMTECMDILESSPEAAPTDRYLCNLVWTHRLAEEVGMQFSMDDPTVVVNIAEPKVQYALRGFERDLSKYSDSIPKEEKRPSLLLSFNVLSLYMHEVALHVDKTDDMRPSAINTESLDDPIPGLSESLTAAHIGALSSCLTAIDGIFETFLSMDVRSIRCLPVFNFVRVAYAVVVLIKMYFSASSPDSELGKVINKDNMKVDEYLDRLLDKFRGVAEGDKSRPAAKFQLVLAMLRGWFQKQGTQLQQQKPEGNGTTAPKAENTPTPGSQQQQQQQQQPPPQQQQHQRQTESDFANTPLQLLSEIATGNDPSRGGKQNGGQAAMPWLTQGWTDLDYNNPGDGFEQAMGLTLQGIGNPQAPFDWENSMRFLMGDGTIGNPMEGVSNTNIFQF